MTRTNGTFCGSAVDLGLIIFTFLGVVIWTGRLHGRSDADPATLKLGGHSEDLRWFASSQGSLYFYGRHLTMALYSTSGWCSSALG